MSIHSDLMRSGAELLFAVQGDAAAVYYQPDGRAAFAWPGASAGAERGGIEELESGDLVKVTRRTVTGPTAALIAQQVTGLERMARVQLAGVEWAIDLVESWWGPEIVRLGLLRRPITRQTEMESRGAAVR